MLCFDCIEQFDVSEIWLEHGMDSWPHSMYGPARLTLQHLRRVALSGLGVPSAAVAACRQFVLYVPGEAEAALQRLRPILEDRLVDPAGPVSASLHHLQVPRPSLLMQQMYAA